jgi:SH3-like domain-containing protein
MPALPLSRLAALILVSVFAAAAAAQDVASVPRFASLRSDEVNLRAGPGKQYPVDWVFTRRALPVEITADYGHWRKIRDIDGSEGWAHQSLLSARRWVMITGEIRTLLRAPEAGAAPVARAEPGVLARLLACRGVWCRVEVERHRGWLRRGDMWGVYPDEVIE